MQSGTQQVLQTAGWMERYQLLGGLVGAIIGAIVGWFGNIWVQAKARRQEREAVVRRLVAPTGGIVVGLRMALSHLDNAAAQGPVAVSAVFQSAEVLFPSNDGDHLSATIQDAAMFNQACYDAWRRVQITSSGATAKYQAIRSLTRVRIDAGEFTLHVESYRRMVNDCINACEAAFTSTRPYASADSRVAIDRFLRG